MKEKIRIIESYDIVTKQSSIDGEFAEFGWYDEKGKLFSTARKTAQFLCDQGAIIGTTPAHRVPQYSTEEILDFNKEEWETRHFHITEATKNQQKAIYKHVVQDQCKFTK